MIRISILFAGVLALSACATTSPPTDIELAELEAVMVPAQLVEERQEPEIQIVERVETLVLPGQLKPLERVSMPVYSPTEAIERGRTSARIEPSVEGYVNAVQVFPFSEGALYRLYCAPGQVTDIALQPGETLISVSAGDTVRWIVGDTHSGAGREARAHVLVKPHSGGLTTNLMIATDRRTYYLEMESTNRAYMAALSWRYPGDELAQMKIEHSRRPEHVPDSVAPGLSLTDMAFDYQITGDEPDWRPVRAFDDGRQVFIQMPDAIGTTDMPPLFVVGENGEAELVNYRIRGRYYIVDRLFQAAELRLGEKRQQVVRISKSQPRRNFLQDIFGD
ncbi:MAG: P-type conjugative transfer protein TrbG [Hyphomonadaceae bacterium]